GCHRERQVVVTLPDFVHTRVRHHVQFCFETFCLYYSTPGISHTLSLHDALPILIAVRRGQQPGRQRQFRGLAAAVIAGAVAALTDRKSTRLNSSHRTSSYAGFFLKKKN